MVEGGFSVGAGALPNSVREARPLPGERAFSHEGELRGTHLLVVDADPLVRELIGAVLRVDGAEVSEAVSAEAALEMLGDTQFDLMILDVGLPGLSGFEVLRVLRERSDIPVMMLTGSATLAERVAGFDLGADDYVLKPIEVQEIGRRTRALLRRVRGASTRVHEELAGPGGLLLRMRSHEAFVRDALVDLTPKEFAVLRLLLDRRGAVVSPDNISLAIWGYETFGSRNFVEAHISRLRSKLAKAGAPDVVTTIRGVGYVIR
ncbi:MAG: DNA-binding response regulator [Chloroflexi bacterium]|nr:MAG: DNA-binding response regulator [Chloroflexota bacterium]